MNRFLPFALILGTITAFAQSDSPDSKVNSVTNNSLVIQEVEVEGNTPADKFNGVEKLEVTGSYIKRVDIEGPSPLEIIDREQFEQTGSTTVTDILKENASFEAVYEDGGMRFHGQHGGNVLILLNGLRVPKQDGGYYTSVNSIPSSIVERIEILKDGSSALYGSDAMSGVINFVTRENINKGEVSASVTQPEIGVGLKQNYVLSYGKSFSRGNIMGLVQYTGLGSFDEYDVGSFNSADKYSRANVSYGNLKAKGQKISIGSKDCPQGTACEADPLQYDQKRPESKEFSTLLSGKYEISSGAEVSFLGSFAQKNELSIEAPRRIEMEDESASGGVDNSIPFSKIEGNALGKFLARSTGGRRGDNYDLYYVPGEELGPLEIETVNQNFSFQSQVKKEFAQTWEWKLQAGYATTQSESTSLSGEADRRLIRQMIYDDSIKLSAITGQASNWSGAEIQPTERSVSNMFTTKMVSAGEIYDLSNLWSSGGPLSLALGLEGQWEDFAFDNDESITSGNRLGNKYDNIDGSRRVGSSFLELSASMTDRLELQLAGRYDNYSDVGDTWNPKLALAYKATQSTLLRASAGTGFRAPGLTDLHSSSYTGVSYFKDPVACANDSSQCSKKYYDISNYADPEVKPETSIHYNIGAVFQPNKRWSMSLDQWNFEGKGTISKVYPENMAEIEQRFGSEALADFGANIVRNNNGEIIQVEYPQLMNMGQRVLRGLDANVEYNQPIRAFSIPMKLFLSSNHSYIFERKTRTFEFEELQAADSTWKNTSAIGLNVRSSDIRLARRAVSSNSVNYRDPGAVVLPNHAEYDVSYSYSAFWKGKMSFTVKNILDERPPVDKSGDRVAFAGLDRNYTVFSPLGRSYYVSYSQTF